MLQTNLSSDCNLNLLYVLLECFHALIVLEHELTNEYVLHM